MIWNTFLLCCWQWEPRAVLSYSAIQVIVRKISHNYTAEGKKKTKREEKLSTWS